jgi:hypothetical protein
METALLEAWKAQPLKKQPLPGQRTRAHPAHALAPMRLEAYMQRPAFFANTFCIMQQLLQGATPMRHLKHSKPNNAAQFSFPQPASPDSLVPSANGAFFKNLFIFFVLFSL